MALNIPQEKIGKLRGILGGLEKTKTYTEIVLPRDEVFARFKPVFSSEHLPRLTADEFRSFLYFENNHHWTGLFRQGPRMCSDIPRLREALSILLDECKPVEERLDEVISMVSGMGKAIASAILLIHQPDKYGVWNSVSEGALKALELWPGFMRGESFGKKYTRINQILLQLAETLQVDLWTLDAVWWEFERDKEPEIPSAVPTVQPIPNEKTFGLERHLQEFMRDNWDRLELGRDWAIYQEPGEPELGYEYPCAAGRIDLLAKHRREPCWLVIELKRNQTGDETVGQVLRYMGYVKKNLAKPGEKTQGLIICHEIDEQIQYALSAVDNVNLMLYEVDFRLKKPEIQT